jgi:flagellar hook-associated protein 2
VSSSNSSTVYGTNVAPISFPGIVSGIDWNSVIDKLTQLQLAPENELNAQIATLNNANTELVKINSLIQSVQNALANLSNPDLFDTYEATSSDPTAVTGTGISGVTATPGIYTIVSSSAATNTSILSDVDAGYEINANGTASEPLADSYASVTPTNGTDGDGEITVDGVQVSYDVNTQSLDTILGNITSAVDKVDPGFLATVSNGVASFTSSDESISVGSSTDQGNLLEVLKLSDAQVLNTGTSGSITGTGQIGGINPDADFNSSNDAGYITPVTAGYFTINGVKITVSTDENLNDVLDAINSSSAGVTASYDADTGQIELVNQNSGPQSIILGASGDTSNFLSASGLTAASGATTTVGKQSVITVEGADGQENTYYNNSNTVTNAIEGISLSITGTQTEPVTINVAQNTSLLVSAMTSFISVYNNAVNEINAATAPPVVEATSSALTVAQSTQGGVLYGNVDANLIVQQLETIVGGFLGSGTTYNSLSQIGVSLDSSYESITANTTDEAEASGNAFTTSTEDGTDGQLQPLDVSQFLSALEADPSAVKNLIIGANSLTTQLGSYLTGVTGLPTQLDSGSVGTIPSVSLIQNYENQNTDTITNLQQQVTQITDSANAYANTLRSEYTSDESTIAGLQVENEELGATFGYSVSTGTSSTSSS